MTNVYRVFCGGAFCFDYRKDGYDVIAARDYRSKLLGNVDLLLRPKCTDGVELSDSVTYVGPFYFEEERMRAEDIICCEKGMIGICTDAIFLLDDAACPGTIAEVMYANFLQKVIHLFYIRHKEDEETESELHTPCWYPILFCQMTNKNVSLYPCSSIEDATRRITLLIESLKV